MTTHKGPDSLTFTVGKLDAGMAILLGERAHLIEFPSILLPPGATTGSIVNIAVHQNRAEEERRDAEFWALQDDILKEYGSASPEPPKLQLRNVTQTSVTLEWPQIKLATAKLRSLDIYKNGQRLASIPSPLTNTSTKLSGLDINAEYTFQLILRTSAGTYPSNLIRARTHTMTDTSGISVCFGNVQDSVLLENSKLALREMRAKWSDKIQIDTTHFVCTTPAATPSGAQATGNAGSAPGIEYQRALQLSIPVVQPHWILACHSEKKMVPIASYYLGASPATPMSSTPFTRPQSMSQASLNRQTPGIASSPKSAGNRASMPPPSRGPVGSPPNNASSSYVGTSPESRARTVASSRIEPTVEEVAETDEAVLDPTAEFKRKSRTGIMNKEFRFPPERGTSPAPPSEQGKEEDEEDEEGRKVMAPPGLDSSKLSQPVSAKAIVTPSSIEVPPPPPVEKERPLSSVDDGEEEVGDTEDIPLN
ncbi:hypothetical protein AX17_002450 [Amanita inopinata Kibby_2008]|nr:hypothetical protein AX17_002450 [Amanita inopinata Kibby_2008]